MKGKAKAAIKKPSKRKPRFSRAHVNRKFKAVTVAGRVTFVGRWTSRVTVSGAKSFSGIRDAQILRHLSTQIYWYVKNELGQSSEQEVRGMLINDRILLSANEDSSMEELASALKKKAKAYAAALAKKPKNLPIHPIKQILIEPHESDRRTKGSAAKLSGVLGGTRKLPGVNAAAVLRAALSQATADDCFATLDISDPASCKTMMTSGAYKHKIIFVVGAGAYHAEQKMVLALYRAWVTSPVTIYGKKRPCSACLTTLQFATSIGLKIAHNLHPGGFWATSSVFLNELVLFGDQRWQDLA